MERLQEVYGLLSGQLGGVDILAYTPEEFETMLEEWMSLSVGIIIGIGRAELWETNPGKLKNPPDFGPLLPTSWGEHPQFFPPSLVGEP